MNSTIFLFIATLLCWGPTWYIIKFQLGTVDPMVSVFYRFFLASVIILFSIFGFAIAGFGVSSVVPICYTLASSIKDVDPTISITVITIAIYGNFMIAPPILGYIANIIGVQFVYLPIVLLFTLSTIIVFSIVQL